MSGRSPPGGQTRIHLSQDLSKNWIFLEPYYDKLDPKIGPKTRQDTARHGKKITLVCRRRNPKQVQTKKKQGRSHLSPINPHENCSEFFPERVGNLWDKMDDSPSLLLFPF